MPAAPNIDWAAEGRALPGGDPKEPSGDALVVKVQGPLALLGAVDGLGHGEEAAAASGAAVRALEACVGLGPAQALDRAHQALRGTRGAAVSLAVYDAEASRLSWAGIGNVEAALLKSGGSRPGRESLVTFPGVVGYRMRPPRLAELEVRDGDLLLFATDGLPPDFADRVDRAQAPREIARGLISACARASDDALVLAIRFLRPLPY